MQMYKELSFLFQANIMAHTFSKCASHKVVGLIVKDGRIISSGVNGTQSGDKNCCEIHSCAGPEHSEWSDMEESHAEENAIAYAAKTGISIDGATMFCTHQPCWKCMKFCVSSGITRLVWLQDYARIPKRENWFNYLERNGIEYQSYNEHYDIIHNANLEQFLGKFKG